MKRISLLILAVAAIIAGSVSCQKINDLDKRLTQLEQTVSDLKAQVLAGAVITSVDKTDDGCTFILSNGQSYTVTNGKNGTDGEAIIADVKIEENFIVLTLKNGETLRISYQNPLSMITLNIVPDYDDGTVREPNTTEYNGEKSTIFYLDIEVTPAKYAEILSDTERFIHKAVFSPIQTKSGFGNAFTVSPKSVTYAEGTPIPFLEACFELDDDTAALLQNKNTPYTISYVIEDKDGVHGAATAFVTVLHEKGSGGGVTDDSAEDAIVINGHKAVKLAGYYWATENVGKCSELTYTYPLLDNSWGCYFYSIRYANKAAQIWGSEHGHKWTIPSNEQWLALLSGCYWEWTDSYNNPDSPDNKKSGYIVFEAKSEEDEGKYGYEAESIYSLATDRHIFLPATGYGYTNDTYAHKQGTEGRYWSATSRTDFRFIMDWFVLYDNGTDSDLAFSVRLVSN